MAPVGTEGDESDKPTVDAGQPPATDGIRGRWADARRWLSTVTVRQWLLAAFLVVLLASTPFGGLRAQRAEATPALELGRARTVQPFRVTITKVREGNDLGVPQAPKIDGRYLVVFATVSSTDPERSVPQFSALRELLRVEGVPGVTRAYGSQPEPVSDDLDPDTILVAEDAQPMGDLAPGLTYHLAFVWRQAPDRSAPTRVRVAAYSHTYRRASIDDTVDWRDPTRAAVGTFPVLPYQKAAS